VDDDERVVRDAWARVAGDDTRFTDVVDDLLVRHREPHRRYHTVAHVAWVVRVAQELLDAAATRDALDEPVVFAAALFHDAIYDTRSADNEGRSADLAADATAALGWAAERTELVTRLVLATASHEPGDRHEEVLLDADLSVLGTDPATYASYVTGVRAEYGHVDDDAWRSGRAEVLRRFLDRPHIYATDAMRSREARARANLTDELIALQL